jgi:hypothetical protein
MLFEPLRSRAWQRWTVKKLESIAEEIGRRGAGKITRLSEESAPPDGRR